MLNNFLNTTIYNQDKKTRVIIIVSALGILLFITLAAVLPFKDQLLSRLYPKPSSSAAPISGPVTGPETSFTLLAPINVEQGQEIRIGVWVRSDLDAANLFVSKLKFPIDLLEVTSTATDSGSIFIKNWAENIFNNQTGDISLIGGVPDPGYQTTTGQSSGFMAEIVFLAKKAGSATVSSSTGSAIYRNTDNVNILNIKRDALFNIIPNLVATISPTSSPAASITQSPTPSVSNDDINGDGRINLIDMSVLLSRWGKKGIEAGKADLNSDGIVNTFDYATMIQVLIKNGVIKTNADLPKVLDNQ